MNVPRVCLVGFFMTFFAVGVLVSDDFGMGWDAYFNPIVRMAGGAERRFDIDDWGSSYRAGLEHVLASEEGPVHVAVGNSPGAYNANLLPRPERERLIFVADRSEAEYFLTNFRFSRETTFPGEEVLSIRVSGNRVLSVYRTRGTTGGLPGN